MKSSTDALMQKPLYSSSQDTPSALSLKNRGFRVQGLGLGFWVLGFGFRV